MYIKSLLNKIKNIVIQNKTMNSLDIISCYTNIAINNALNFLLFNYENLIRFIFPDKTLWLTSENTLLTWLTLNLLLNFIKRNLVFQWETR